MRAPTHCLSASFAGAFAAALFCGFAVNFMWCARPSFSL